MKKLLGLLLFIGIYTGHHSSAYAESVIPFSEIFEEETDLMVLQRPLFDLSTSPQSIEDLLTPASSSIKTLPVQYSVIEKMAQAIPFHSPQREIRNARLEMTDSDIPHDQFFIFPSPIISDAIRWQAQVINDRGQMLQSWSGIKNPPDKFEWDGKKENWNRIHPSATYTLSVEWLDAKGEKRKSTQGPIRFTHFSQSIPSGKIIYLNSNLLFAESSNQQLSSSGEKILRSLFQPSSTEILVTIHIYTNQLLSFQKQEKTLRNFFSTSTDLNSHQIQIKELKTGEFDPEITIEITEIKR